MKVSARGYGRSSSEPPPLRRLRSVRRASEGEGIGVRAAIAIPP